MPQDSASVASPDAIDHLRWSLTPEVGPIRFARIIGAFGSARAALGAGAGQLARIDGIGHDTASRIASQRDQVDVEAELELARRHSVRLICSADAEYPVGLRHISDPPICLYIRGRLEPEDAVAIGVVGSRRCTHYGREQAYRFGYQLASAGVTVVSGLARGVDSESHKGALAASGRTLAVLGNGLANIYPPEHAELADRIASRGAVLSELPMTTSPSASNFLPRNRLIAGLSLGILVVEAAQRSGSLTTARLASEYDREVFAVPGRVDNEFAHGTNRLIRDQHAKLVISVEDIVNELGEVGQALGVGQQNDSAAGSAAPAAASLGDQERAVLEVLQNEAVSIETIAEATGQPPARIAAALIGLQLRGLARQLPGNVFVRAGKR